MYKKFGEFYKIDNGGVPKNRKTQKSPRRRHAKSTP